MDDAQEQDHYEERLKEVFNSFDASGSGSLCPEELSDLCQSLHLEDATPALLHALLQNQDHHTGRVNFDQFKTALILVLSSTIEPPQAEQETLPKPDSPEIQPKFVKGSKRYGRRSTPEFIEPISDQTEVASPNPVEEEEDPEEDIDDSAVPRKRERWNVHETSTEEYEAEGQMHLWNPDEPSTPRGSVAPLSERLEERLREACDELEMAWDGYASHTELLALCEHLGLEIKGDVLQSGDGVMNVQEFVSRVVNHSKPPTPSASTPYRQLKRHHSTQPFDEGGRRIASTMTSTIGMRLFSTLDDGSGYTPVEYILDAWMEEGVENSTEILQALDFSLDGKLNLSELTVALENELLVTKNGIHQAALASFKAEIRYLLECVDRELREKEKIRSDLEKAEKLKSQLATEVDEHHSAIERMNNLNLRNLEQDHKEKLAAVRTELIKEMDQIQQQASLQREELEAEIEKIREDESFLRDHLSISVKENRRLEMELLDSNEKVLEAQSQIAKLQMGLDNVLKEKFGDLDPGSADFFIQEERIKQLRSSYEAQCRELQDRIDELQSELQEFHILGRAHQPCNKPISEEMESKSPGMESDPGIGSEEGQPFNMSLEAEMMLEQLKERHLREMEDLQTQLESKISEFDKMVEEQRVIHEEQKAAISLHHQEEVQALREEMTSVQGLTQELQNQLQQAELEHASLERRQAGEREELQNQQEGEVGTLRQQVLEAHTRAADLEDQLNTLEAQQAETELNLDTEMEELKKRHALEMKELEEHKELLEARLEEERVRLQEERDDLERRLLEGWEREKEQLQQSHKDELRARLEEARVRFEEEHDELVKRLTEEWQKEKAQLDEQSNEALQVVLEEEMLRLLKEQEEKESKLRQQWEVERAQLQERQEEALLTRVAEERLRLQAQHEQREERLQEEWERERSQLEEDYEGMLGERLNEEREKLEFEKEELEKRLEQLVEEEKVRLEESYREAMQQLTDKHSEERERLGGTLDKLRDDIAQERRELEIHITRRIKEVEERFSGDQESVAMRFQADVLKLEQHYQNELKALSENHAEQKLKWEAETEKALEEAEEQRRKMQEAAEQKRERLHQEWAKEKLELESRHRENMEALTTKNQELQRELDDFVSAAQTNEIELSRQLNNLHDRLQESRETKDELLAVSERKTIELELLLNEAVADFRRERAELQGSLSELEAKYDEALSTSQRQIEERIQLLTERDDLKAKIEELEMLLQQAVVDFELDRQELRENISVLEEKLQHNLSCCESQANESVELIAERDLLSIRLKEMEMELSQRLASAETAEKIKTKESNDVEEKAGECISFAGKDPEMYSHSIESCGEMCGDNEAIVIPEDYNVLDFEFVDYLDQVPEVEIIIKPSNKCEICPNNDIESNWEGAPDRSLPVGASPVTETPDAIEGCPENIDCVDECDNEAVETDQEQDGDDVKEYKMAKNPTCLEQINVSGEECDHQVVPEDRRAGESSSPKDQTQAGDKTEQDSRPLEWSPSNDHAPESLAPEETQYGHAVDENSAVENASSPEALEHEDAGGEATDCENSVALESCDEENKLQHVLVLEKESSSNEEAQCHEIVVGPLALVEAGDSDELMREVSGLPNYVLSHGEEVFSLEFQQTTTETDDEQSDCAHDSLEPQDRNGHCEDQDCSLLKLQALYGNATDENILLQERISLLQQKTDTLEVFLVHNNERIESGHRALEENHNLKVKTLLLMEQVKELEMKALEMTGLQFRYEDCIWENAKLKDQNSELEKRVWGLENRVHLVHDFHGQQMALVGEIARMREGNAKLSELVSELERQDEIVLARYPDARSSETTAEESFQDLNIQPEPGIQAVTDLEDSCMEVEEHNTRLRSAITELQDKSLTLSGRIHAHRSEASRLAEENLVLSREIAALKEEGLKEAQEDLLQKLEHFRKDKIRTQKMTENFKKQISELHLRGQQVEDENRLLSEENTQTAASVEELSRQLEELTKENERREAESAEKTTQMEAELIKTLEGTAQLEERNAQLARQLSGLREKAAMVDTVESELGHLLQERKGVDKEIQGLHNQLTKAQERVKTVEETLQAANLQSSRLKADLRVSQQERDSLKREVVSLRKQLQNANDKNHVLEMARQASGFQSQNKKLHRDEMSRLLKQEQQVLRQENERLQAELRNTKDDSREKIRQLEATILSLKQHRQQNQSSLVKALEQEKASLKQELEAKKELTRGCETGEGHAELESLQQENEALKAQMARMSTQLIETFQAQLVGLLPPSPHRMPRAQHRGDDPDNLQGERERKMKNMEERMKEIELSLHNVKLLLREKVVQLKDQLHKNGKADVLIKDLYVENSQLLQALEITEQRQKIAEKKNYLLEEKISSLNRIVRDLNPSPLPPAVPYHFTCS